MIVFNGVAIETKAPRARKDRGGIFPRKDQLPFIRAIMSAESMADAIKVVRKEAIRLTLRSPGTEWGIQLTKLADSLAGLRGGFTVISVEGNAKLPFASFSTLPYATCPGMGACASFCYSLRAWQYPSALMRQVQNTLLVRFDPDRIREAFRTLPEGIILRLYVDGDFDSVETVDLWMGLLAERPDIRAYGYSKSWDILRTWGESHEWPGNYMLNLSSGEKRQTTSREQMRELACVRGDFLAVSTGRPMRGKGSGFSRYQDKAYHDAVRDAAAKQGLGKVFSCPGKCGECAGGRHACGNDKFQGITIVIGVH